MSPHPDHPDQSPPPMPRWVKIVGLLAVLAVLIFGGIHLVGGGFRGHGMPATHEVPTP